MADVGEEEEEYESDPEQAKRSLTMRRREASDDEGEEEDDDGGGGDSRRIDARVSDYESDGQGAAAEYDDEESELEEEEEEEEEELLEEVEEEVDFGGRHGGVEVQAVGAQVTRKDLDGGGVAEGASAVEKREDEQTDTDGRLYVQDNEDQVGDNANGGQGEGGQAEKKENEPFAVPTAGAFYMHDDRFRDSAGGRHRRTLGGRKLWESKDDRKWGHDKFEEITMQERHYEEGRRGSRGRNRARGRNRGEDRGYSRGNRPKTYNNNNQNNAPKSVRGRGPRRYQPSTKNNNEAPTQSRQPAKSVEKNSNASSGRVSVATSSSESAQVPARKNIFASSLNSASPPFYPSGSSNKEINLTQKRDAQTGPINRSARSSAVGEHYPIPQSSNMRGKNVSDSLGMDKLYIDDSLSSLAGKPLNNLPLSASGTSFINPTQPSQTRIQGRGSAPLTQMAYQNPVPPHNQANRVSSPNQVLAFQRAHAQNRLQPNPQPSGQQMGPRSASGSQASSPPKAPGSLHSFESTEQESSLESNSKTAMVGKGKGSIQSSGMSSFPYPGAQVMGASGSIGGNHADQNFPGTPAFLPVMQFGGQHPGGIPAVGMAFPGYVAQPNGMGNSEMTWLPVLAGAAGALGATYCSPYITMEGAYHARPSGQTCSVASASSKDSNTNKLGNEVKSSQRPELANDELGQRQNKARRYTEMKFDQ